MAPIEPAPLSVGGLQGAIGVFDSGIGGLSVLKALRAEMPQERFIYWADSGYAPYGERSDEFLFDFPRANVPEDMEVEEGMQVHLQDSAGNPVPATVVAIGAETIKMDCNHPLAGKTLEFDISIAEMGLTPDAGSCAPSSCGSCGCGCKD